MNFPETLFVQIVDNRLIAAPRREMLDIGQQRVMIAEYKLVRKVDVKMSIEELAKVG